MENKIGNITVNITNRCNYLCTHCSFDSGIKKIEECSTQEWIDFLKEAREGENQGLDISGGEPTLRKDLQKIVKSGVSLGYKVKLLTNGAYLTDNLLQELKISGLESIAISLDGSNSSTHNAIRKKGEEEFNLTLEKIKLVKDYGFFIKVNTVAANSNLYDLPKVIELCEKIRVDEHRICYFTPTGRGGEYPDGIHPIKWLNFIRENLSTYRKNERVYIGIPFLEEKFQLDTACWLDRGIFPLHVLPNGDIYSCSIQASRRKPIGSIKGRNIKETVKLEKRTKSCCFDYSSYFENISGNEKIGYVCPLRKYKLKEII